MKTIKNNKQTIKKTKKKKYIGGYEMTQEEIIIDGIEKMINCLNYSCMSQTIEDIKVLIKWVNEYEDVELKNEMVKILSPIASKFNELGDDKKMQKLIDSKSELNKIIEDLKSLVRER